MQMSCFFIDKNRDILLFPLGQTGFSLGGNLPCSMDSKQRVPFRANWENDHAFRDKVHNFGRGTQSVTYRHPPTFHGFIFHLPYEGRAE